MSYCSSTDIEKLIDPQTLAELTTETGDIPDAGIIAEAIAKAGALIDSYCGLQYSVPFSPVPEIIESLSVDIAVYRLYLRRSVVPDPARQRYEDAISFLKDVSAGRATIGATASPPDSTQGSHAVEIDGNDRIFTRDYMAGL